MYSFYNNDIEWLVNNFRSDHNSNLCLFLTVCEIIGKNGKSVENEEQGQGLDGQDAAFDWKLSTPYID